jgi:phosphoglycerol transferase MdoB-like AlkP superfamily enzyme
MPRHSLLRYAVLADVSYLLGGYAVLLLLFAIGRTLLLLHNSPLAAAVPSADIATAYAVGMRFDLIVSCWVLSPLALLMLLPTGLARRRWYNAWLTVVIVLNAFLIVLELDFYREFHTRLNSLVFQYVREDPKTVFSMLWYGYPVLRYLALCSVLSIAAVLAIHWVDRKTRWPAPSQRYRYRLLVAIAVLLITASGARGTFRSGPPLRWGDAFHTTQLFANHLALNGTFTLVKAAQQGFGNDRANPWLRQMPPAQALALVRHYWLHPQDTLQRPDVYPLLRQVAPPATASASSYQNVVVIIDESFSAQRIGVFGNPLQVTPQFDQLAGEGLLFDHFFSSGTHTHQGMFATLACFPNLPHYEYLMQQPEGGNNFSGLAKILSARHYDNAYIYNGDFTWDNQLGFFRAQGMRRFIGRYDFVNPRFADRTWGVSDQDMFERGYTEIEQLQRSGKPYFAVLQTLSNHAPYALPPQLPVAPVMVNGVKDEHLTAMRYNDFALGEFFSKVRQHGGFDNTLFVVLGDHGFGGEAQITDIDLWRFHVPLLFWGKDVQKKFGARRSVVGSQVDVVPTIMGLLGGRYEHHCWGRDLLALPVDDPGLAVIKPSGTDFTVALVEGEHILVQAPGSEPHLFQYTILPHMTAMRSQDAERQQHMGLVLGAYLQTATQALLDNRVGHGDDLTPGNNH